jgi:hypothetical protein
LMTGSKRVPSVVGNLHVDDIIVVQACHLPPLRVIALLPDGSTTNLGGGWRATVSLVSAESAKRSAGRETIIIDRNGVVLRRRPRSPRRDRGGRRRSPGGRLPHAVRADLADAAPGPEVAP